MDGDKFKSITDVCIASGRLFEYEAKRLAKEGIIDPQDPRVVHATRGSALPVPSSAESYGKIWKQLLTAEKTRELKPTLLLARKAMSAANFQHNVSPRDLAVCLESAACRADRISNPSPGSMDPGSLVEYAALVCDGAVLRARHRSPNESVASVAESSGVPPQRVLSGMVRMGMIDEKDHRVQAFVEGHLGDFNNFDRTEFFRESAREIKSAIRDFGSLNRPEIEKNTISKSLLRLNAANQSESNPVVKESDVLSATADLAEAFGVAFKSTDPERSKRLAGLSMSSTSRSHLIKQQYPEKFIMSGVQSTHREPDQQE